MTSRGVDAAVAVAALTSAGVRGELTQQGVRDVIRLGHRGADLGRRIDREPLEHLRRRRHQRELPQGSATWVHDHGVEDDGGEQIAHLIRGDRVTVVCCRSVG
jgi:hypothetical protein